MRRRCAAAASRPRTRPIARKGPRSGAMADDPKTSAAPGTAPDSSLGSALCTQCGLCCTGALHKAAVLDPDEIADARALGLPILDREKPGFALPCPRLDGTVCTIYASRPRVCGRYKCQLL